MKYETVADIIAERDALKARLAEAERDAERYRWLCLSGHESGQNSPIAAGGAGVNHCGQNTAVLSGMVDNAALKALTAENARLRATLIEVRLRMQADGKHPLSSYEMRIIDSALADSAEKITFDPQPRELYEQVAAKYRPSDSADVCAACKGTGSITYYDPTTEFHGAKACHVCRLTETVDAEQDEKP